MAGTAEPQSTHVPPGSRQTASSANGEDATAGKDGNWRFLEPQPIREDQVENAVNFLSHLKVKGSPVIYRRSFLEKKGLTREEIDEAFRRVPDVPSDSSSNTASTSVGQTAAVNSQVGHVLQPFGKPVTRRQLATKSRNWGQMLLYVGVLVTAGTGAGVFTKKYFIPKFKNWLLEIVSGKSVAGKTNLLSPMEEATREVSVAAKQLAAATQDLVKYKYEEHTRLDSIMRAIEAQTLEMKNMLAGIRDNVQIAEVTKYQRCVTNDFQSNEISSPDSLKGQTNVVRPTSGSDTRGLNARIMNHGAPADPSLVFGNKAPQGLVHFAESTAVGSQVNPTSPSPSIGQIHAPQSQAYQDVLALLERGEKPPGIKEVNDKPPILNQPLSNPHLQTRPKPWEKSVSEVWPVNTAGSGDTSQPLRYQENWSLGWGSAERSTSFGTGSSSEPWWRNRRDSDTIFSSSSVKITEVDQVSEVDIGTIDVEKPSNLSSFGPNMSRKVHWIPPPVPQPIYPGADEAIRYSKPAIGETSARALSSQAEVDLPGGAFRSSQVNKSLTHVSTNVIDNSMQSSSQLLKTSGDQDADHLDKSLVETTLTVRDLDESGPGE